jgi:thiopeptide-type bacteriocin biosynthesis protein
VNSWRQVNVALDRSRGPALQSARRVLHGLAPLLDDLRADGRLHRFHFMRKPPDIRLRLAGPAPDDMVPPVLALLRRLADEGAVLDVFTSVYEPQVHLFGGPAAMALVHDHFDVDSQAWIDHDSLQAAGTARLPVQDLTTAVLNDLFARALDDHGEVWETWCNLCDVIGATTGSSDDTAAASAAFPADLTDLAEEATPQERPILTRYRSANDRLATGLRELWSTGQLQCGLRGMLPFVGVFHFHRYGLDAHRQATQALAMRRAWDPRRGLRGCE